MIASTALLIYGMLLPCTPAQEPKTYDWPQWRGPDRSAVSPEKNLLSSWPKNGPPLVWKATHLGGGYSTPSVADGRIFGMSYRNDEEVIWALEESTGKEIWVRSLGAKGKAAYNEGPRSTPTVDQDRLYSLGISGDLVCLQVKDGAIVWRRSFSKDFHGKMMSNWGFSESPLIDGDSLIVTPGDDLAALVALEKKTGKTIWASEISECGGAGYSSIMPIEVDGKKMYVTWMGMKKDVQGKTTCGKGLVGVDALTGKFLWQYCRIANATANIPTVLVRDRFLFCSSGYPDGGTALLKLSVQKAEVLVEEIAYHAAKVLQNHHGGMVRVGEYVYFGRGQKNGLPTCVEFATAKIIWQEDRGPVRGSAAVCAADGMVYFRYEDGTVALIETTPKGYHLVSQFTLPDPSGKPGWAHPIIANGKLFLRDQDSLFCFDVRKK